MDSNDDEDAASFISPITNEHRRANRMHERNEDNESESLDDPVSWTLNKQEKVRVLIGFWILGLCNNFGYVVMLSAAYDILQPKAPEEKCADNATVYSPHHLICNTVGTGTILLADILPTIFIKFSAPFYMHRIAYNLRMGFIILFNSASFLLVAFAGSQVKWLSYLGVVCASISSGFGEIVMLSFSSYFSSHSISTWSSGTGAAGIFGAITYSGLTQLKLSPKNTLLIMLVVPVCQALSYYGLLVKPPHIQSEWSCCWNGRPGDYESLTSSQLTAHRKNVYTLPQMVRLVKPLLKFMIPLMFVYMAEYFINQALFELLYFTSSCGWMSIESQYRWFQTIYQVGVFLSRSSLMCFKFNLLWLLPLLQFGNLAILLCQVFYHFIPEHNGIWIVFAIILWEGCLGGLGYVHTFYQISQQVEPEHKEFSMGVASVADTSGIVISAFLSILAHNAICNIGITW